MLFLILLSLLLALVVWLLMDEETELDKLPGPPRRPVIGSALTFIRLVPSELFTITRQLAKDYGDRYLIKVFKRRILHLHNPKDVEIVLSHSRNISKSKPYSFLRPWLGTGLLLSTGSKWHNRRKILTPTFHFNILKNFAAIIEEKSRDLVLQLRETRGAEVNLYPRISDFTLYTICETAMGTQLDKDKSLATSEYKAAILDMGRLLVTRLTRFWLHIDVVFRSLPVGKQFNKAVTKIHSFADNVIKERKNQRVRTGEEKAEDVFGSKKRLAMLDLLLEAEEKGEIDLEGIREEVNTFMFEGHDTTATAITFGLMLLADHEDVQNRIYEECQRIFGDSDRVANMADLNEMKYLEVVIKEILRLYPPVPFIARQITEDVQLDGLLVKKGTEVAVHIFDLHRREDLYSEPHLFRPERFLEGSSRHPYAYVPFSAGPRNCIGQRFAMQELKCAFSEVCRNFRLQPRIQGWRPRCTSDMVLRTEEPIYVKFISR